MKTKTLAVALFAAVMTVTIGMQPVFAADATGSATIEPKTCGLTLSGLTSVDYGNLVDGSFGQGNALHFNNTGNSAGDVFISGTNWYNATNSTQTVMNANQTHYIGSSVGGENGYPITGLSVYSVAQDLNTTPELVNTLSSNNVITFTFGLIIDLIDPLFEGAIQQTMTFTTECG